MNLKENGESKRLSKALIILLRGTTWKCGRLERLIVEYLRGRTWKFGKPQISVKELIQKFKLQGKRKDEFLDAIKRLEKRNIIKVLKF